MKKLILLSFALILGIGATAQTSKKNQKEPERIPVLDYYYELPQQFLPQIASYIERRKKEAPLVKTVDNKDLRKGFILDKDYPRGYLNLQLPNEANYTRIQMVKDEVVAVEVMDCSPKCKNQLNIYEKSYYDSTWTEVNSTYLPELDMKFVKKKLKDGYKSQYMDLDLYDARGYEDETVLRESLQYVISPEANKIIIKEPHLPINIYELTWDDEKNKYVLNKL